MDIHMVEIANLARIGQEDRLGSAGLYRQGEPSRIIGLVGLTAGAFAAWSTAVERWAGHSRPVRQAPGDRTAARQA